MKTKKHLTLKERRKIQKRWELCKHLLMVSIGIFALYVSIHALWQTDINNASEYYNTEKVFINEEKAKSIEDNLDNEMVNASIELREKEYEPIYIEETELTEPSIIINKTDTVMDSEEKIEKETKVHDGEEMYVPGYCGSVHPYMGWECITDPTSPQYRLKQECEAYDENGFGKVGNRYAVAMKSYYGDIGDYIDIVQNDGIEYHCIIVDHKGMENESEDGWLATYAHGENDIVEFVVNKSSWYGTNKTVAQYHPEFSRNIKAIYNTGNYWD